MCLGCGSAVLVSVCGRSAGERCPLPHGRRAVSVCRCVCVSGAGGQLGHTQAPPCGRELVSALCVPAGTGRVSRAQRVEDAVRAQGGVPPLGRRPLCPRPWATRGTAAGPALLAYGPWGQRTWPCGGAGSFSPGCAGLGGGPGGSPGGIQGRLLGKSSLSRCTVGYAVVHEGRVCREARAGRAELEGGGRLRGRLGRRTTPWEGSSTDPRRWARPPRSSV